MAQETKTQQIRAQVEIYTTRYCPYCLAAKALLKRKAIAFIEIDVGGEPELRRKMVKRANGGYTVPQIFIGATHVGGSDELHELERYGRLDALLVAEGVAAGEPGPSA
ncbi:MAG: glutaredoxin 3 [Alphaproteobacteria bacterium]|jgi:glutaredoxin 3|nr:glutaredoxin 3 [Alphaproteobacteria bacterium]